MLTNHDIDEMIAAWMVEYPKYAIRFSGLTGDSAYRFTCPGWSVMVAPLAWKERWDALPGPKMPELSEAEFDRFFDEWARHIQVATLTRRLKPDLA